MGRLPCAGGYHLRQHGIRLATLSKSLMLFGWAPAGWIFTIPVCRLRELLCLNCRRPGPAYSIRLPRLDHGEEHTASGAGADPVRNLDGMEEALSE